MEKFLNFNETSKTHFEVKTHNADKECRTLGARIAATGIKEGKRETDYIVDGFTRRIEVRECAIGNQVELLP